MSEIRVRNWKKWQTYRSDRGQPPWIKVHRQIMRDPAWVELTDAQRGQLVAIWLLAADRDGAIPASPAIIRKLCFMETDPDLQTLVRLGFLEPDATTAPTRRQHDVPEAEAETEAETEKKTTAAAPPEPIVEKSGDAPTTAEPVRATPELPTYTLAALAEAARVKLGLARLRRDDEEGNKRILREWLFAGSGKRRPEDILAAIEGLSDMRNRGLVGWEGVTTNTPMGLRALQKAQTLDHTGDGAVRSMWDVALEHQRKRDEAALAPSPTARTKGTPMRPLASPIPEKARTA